DADGAVRVIERGFISSLRRRTSSHTTETCYLGISRFVSQFLRPHMRQTLLVVAVSFLLVPAAHAQDEARLLRFPAIHGDTVAFSYAGNLYTVPAAGGIARKLTNHEGYEMFAHF